ncbi:hypothetical protein BDR03DRAFT_461197 [Suillus americanus]|nr:hypothetical protein BDR03DRAFT_461197 [Suillus americanus]
MRFTSSCCLCLFFVVHRRQKGRARFRHLVSCGRLWLRTETRTWVRPVTLGDAAICGSLCFEESKLMAIVRSSQGLRPSPREDQH